MKIFSPSAFSPAKSYCITGLALILFSIQFAVAQNVTYKEKPLNVTKQKTNGFDEATLRAKMKADGLSAPVIDKLIAQRKLWLQRGKNVYWTNVKNAGQHPIVNAPCTDLGVENGWGAWQGMTGSESSGPSQSWNPPATTPFAPNFVLTGAGVDPNTPGPAGPPTDPAVPYVCPGFGNTSIQIGEPCTAGCVCEQLTYPLTVTANDTNFVYAYAIVIEDAGHATSDQPFVSLCIYDAGGNPIPCGCFTYTGGPNIPGFHSVSGSGCGWQGTDQYKPWTLVGVNLSSYVGQTVNIVITNADCAQCGHWAYSYWDFLCGTASLSAGCTGNQSTICAPSDPQIAYTYQWYQNGVPIAGGTQQCITVTPQQGDTFTVEVQQPSGCNFHLGYVPAVALPNFTYTGQCNNFVFTDNSTVAPSSATITGWNWSFQGGSPATATSQTVAVTYPAAGNYVVTLTVTCSAGCSAVTTQTITVNGLPTAAFSNTPVCAGIATQFTDNSTSAPGDPIASWNWSFVGGNPASSTSQNPTSTFPPGNYTASLTVTSQQGCTSTISQPVTVNPPPLAIPSGTNVCFNNLSTFTDLSIYNNTYLNCIWNFGDGNTSTTQSPTHTYASPGNYTVMLTVTNNFGCKDSNSITVVVNPLPVANFSSVPVCFHDPTCFTDLSTISSGNVTGWSWNFGDPSSGPNNISLVQSPCHVFTGLGPFTVLLTVTSDSGCQSTTQLPATINPLPVAGITPQNVCFNFPASFNDASTAQPNDPLTAWDWDFGDGSPHSGLTNTSHNYAAPGTYTVTLIVTSTNGCKDTTTNTVTIYNSPVAAFTSPDSGCSPVCQTFQDLSTSQDGNVTNWAWNFPGGSPAVGVNSTPTSCWNNPGSYSVQLIVTTQYGCKDTLLIPNYINVFAWPDAEFTVAPPINSVNSPEFSFSDLWSSDVTQWVWDFGDNTSDNTSTNPVHSYSATATNNDFYIYTVCLFVQNVHGCYDSICHNVELDPEYEFFIPNCVTPNNDNINDLFFGKSRGVKDYNIWLFDRWGNLIWDCHWAGRNIDWDDLGQDGMSSACKWDGKVEGGNSNTLVQEDVYVWKVRLTDIFDKVHTYIGHVSVVK